jgi:hypothetical protein
MARRLQAERAKWELERERTLLAERDQVRYTPDKSHTFFSIFTSCLYYYYENGYILSVLQSISCRVLPTIPNLASDGPHFLYLTRVDPVLCFPNESTASEGGA